MYAWNVVVSSSHTQERSPLSCKNQPGAMILWTGCVSQALFALSSWPDEPPKDSKGSRDLPIPSLYFEDLLQRAKRMVCFTLNGLSSLGGPVMQHIAALLPLRALTMVETRVSESPAALNNSLKTVSPCKSCASATQNVEKLEFSQRRRGADRCHTKRQHR